jgi:transposase
VVQRARILPLAADGVANTEIAERFGISRPTVIAWRKRYLREGLAHGLADRPRRGRPQTVRRDRRAEILVAAIRRFCDGWNQRCRPLCWTKDAEQILATLERPASSG